MPRVKQKIVRYADDIVEVVARLRYHFPEYTDDSKILTAMIRDQALIMATHATRPGGEIYAGYDPQDLVARLAGRRC